MRPDRSERKRQKAWLDVSSRRWRASNPRGLTLTVLDSEGRIHKNHQSFARSLALPATKRILLTGATGFIGQHLYPRLVEDGYEVVCATRRPEEAETEFPEREWVKFDVEDPTTLEGALKSCDIVFYLIHQMGGGEGYRERERQAAMEFRSATEEAGVERVIYLGGVEPQGEPSEHLASRLETGRILRGGEVTTIELRAAMIIGAGSASWRIVRDLAARLPFMLLPSWTRSRSEPLDIADVVEALAGALTLETASSKWYDIPGPKVMTVEEIILQTAEMMGNDTPSYPVPLLSPKLSSYWLRFVTRCDYHLASELVQGLKSNLIACNGDYWDAIGHVDRVPFKDATRRALEDSEPESGWARAYESVIRSI